VLQGWGLFAHSTDKQSRSYIEGVSGGIMISDGKGGDAL
jgi:hypothetical protein